jgi:hypothetical protein
MRAFVLPSLAAGLALALVACGGGGDKAAPAAQAPATQAAPPAAAASAGDFGVPECDSFFTKYFACIDANVPEAGRAMARQAAEQTKTSLQQAAKVQGGADALKTACSQAEETAKKSMAAYNCEW